MKDSTAFILACIVTLIIILLIILIFLWVLGFFVGLLPGSECHTGRIIFDNWVTWLGYQLTCKW